LRGWTAVYYRELLILKRKFAKLLLSMSVSPFLFLVTFGYAIGKTITIQGHTYMEFLIPGLIAMSSMRQAFGIASEINVARFYWHIFEEFQTAPLTNIAYVTGEVLAGITRALLSVIVILVFGLIFGVILSFNVWFWLAILLNSFVFASLAVGLAMLVRSHADQAMLSNFVITPMAFLGGTFFPVDRLPAWAQHLLALLPLTHASKAIRNASFGNAPEYFSYILLAVLGCLFFIMAFYCVNSAKD
jgi:Nod factor-specific ABC transporter NodJ protein